MAPTTPPHAIRSSSSGPAISTGALIDICLSSAAGHARHCLIRWRSCLQRYPIVVASTPCLKSRECWQLAVIEATAHGWLIYQRRRRFCPVYRNGWWRCLTSIEILSTHFRIFSNPLLSSFPAHYRSPHCASDNTTCQDEDRRCQNNPSSPC